MRTYVFLTVLCALPFPLVAFASPDEAAVKAYPNMEKALSGTPFTGPRLSPEGRFVVEVADTYEPKLAPFSKRDQWVESLCQTWTEALRQAGASTAPGVAVLSSHGGTVYECVDGESSAVETWDDRKMPFTTINPIGNLLMSIAGQISSGPDTPSTWGFNFTEVITMYKNIWDLGFSESLIKTNTTASLGVVARARPRFTRSFGMTFGAQPMLQVALPEGATQLSSSFVFGLQGGFNFYTASGSIDLTGLFQTDGMYTVAIGYTFFLNHAGAQ